MKGLQLNHLESAETCLPPALIQFMLHSPEALSNAGKELLVLTNRLEDSGQSISDQLRQMDAMYSKPSEARKAGEKW